MYPTPTTTRANEYVCLYKCLLVTSKRNTIKSEHEKYATPIKMVAIILLSLIEFTRYHNQRTHQKIHTTFSRSKI